MDPRVLIVDDDEKILFAFKEVLRRGGYTPLVASNGEEALAKIAAEGPAVVFMDITMPKLDGLAALRRIKERHHGIPVVIITGYGTMQTAIRAMQLGAFDYLTKPLDVAKIRDVARRALGSAGATAGGEATAEQVPAGPVARYELVGNSPRMQEIYKLIGSISTTPAHTSVLIVGESGTGKELVARSIHAHSANAAEPFVAINCTALPESLLESELFGHERGAFTGASERKVGKFEIAEGGSIFLDEIGNLTADLQQKLLRVLQEREFERVGGNEAIPVKARFLAATNRDIKDEIKNGRFREDLFYRLNVVTVALPPLRDHREDVPLLANYFLARYNEQLRKSIRGYSNEAMALLQAYAYPGNVRELENLVEHAVMLTTGETILAETLGRALNSDARPDERLPIVGSSFSQSREHLLDLFEVQFVTEQLIRHRGNVTAAAKASQMTRQNFIRLMGKHQIRSERFRS